MKIITSLLMLITSVSFAQFQYVSPVPNSKNNTVEHNIIIREGSKIVSSSINNRLFSVAGSKSGVHRFKMVLALDQKTIILTPETHFAFDEIVTVTISAGLKSETKKLLRGYSFSFSTHREYTAQEKQNFLSAKNILLQQEMERNGISNTVESDEEELRDISGGYIVHKNTNSTPGELFFDAWGSGGSTKYDGYNILKPNGDSVYFSSFVSFCTDFDLNPNGYLSYYNGGYAVLDSNYNLVDQYYAANGFGTDAHEFTMDVDGSSWMIAADYDVLDMTVYDPSYCSNATIIYGVVQQFDADKNLIFEWNGKDHIDVTEAPHENLAFCYIDYMHMNSLDIDPDGNVIFSNRHLDQISKIDKNTGDFIWRLGGDSNQFVFINEPEPFTYQHSARQVSNGNLILWDNGDWHSPAHSMAKEYKLDLENMTATLVWSFQPKTFQNNDAYFWAMGSVQRLWNGNTMVGGGWDGNSNQSNFFEVDTAGTVVWELELSNVKNLVSYRIAKHLWNPCAPVTSNNITVTKITSTSAKINWTAVNNTTSYDVQYRKAKKTEWKTKNTTNLSKKISNLASDIEYVYQVRANCTNGHSSDWSPIDTFKTLPARMLDPQSAIEASIELSPNPTSGLITIEFELEANQIVQMNLYDVAGKLISSTTQSLQAGDQTLQFDVSDFTAGVYMAEFSSEEVKKIMKFVKQ